MSTEQIYRKHDQFLQQKELAKELQLERIKSSEQLIKDAFNQSEIGDSIISEHKVTYPARSSFDSARLLSEDAVPTSCKRTQNTTTKKAKFNSLLISKPYVKIDEGVKFGTNNKDSLTIGKNQSQSHAAVANLADRFERVQNLHEPAVGLQVDTVAKVTSFVKEDNNAVTIALTDLKQAKSPSKVSRKKRLDQKQSAEQATEPDSKPIYPADGGLAHVLENLGADNDRNHEIHEIDDYSGL